MMRVRLGLTLLVLKIALAIAEGRVHTSTASDWCSGGVCQEWAATLGSSWYGQVAKLAVDDTGNVYVAASSREQAYADLLVVKYDGQGNQVWQARYDGPAHGDDIPSSVALDDSGNVYVTGSSQASTSYDDYECVTVKYDSGGNQMWASRYRGTNDAKAECGKAVIDENAVYVVGTSTSKTSSLDSHYLTIKYGLDGVLQWTRTYDGPYNRDYGGDIAFDEFGDIYVTGSSEKYVDPDFATIKYDSDGNQLWVRRWGGYGYDYAHALTLDSSGNVFVAGETGIIGSPYSEYAIVKYGSDGDEKWEATYHPSANGWDQALDVGTDASDAVYVTGTSTAISGLLEYATIKYQSDGTQDWVAHYQESPSQHAAALTMGADGAIYVTGVSGSDSRYYEYATVKYDAEGNQVWAARYPMPSVQSWIYGGPTDIAVDSVNNVYVAGNSGSQYASVKYSQPPEPTSTSTPSPTPTATPTSTPTTTATPIPTATPARCRGDVDGDGDVDAKDLSTVARALFSQPGERRWNASADVNGDGRIDLRDLQIVLQAMLSRKCR